MARRFLRRSLALLHTVIINFPHIVAAWEQRLHGNNLVLVSFINGALNLHSLTHSVNQSINLGLSSLSWILK